MRTSSRDVVRPARMAACISGIVASTSVELGLGLGVWGLGAGVWAVASSEGMTTRTRATRTRGIDTRLLFNTGTALEIWLRSVLGARGSLGPEPRRGRWLLRRAADAFRVKLQLLDAPVEDLGDVQLV